MNVRIALLVALAMTGTTLALAPTANAWACGWSGNPFPPSPVGGAVGAIYTAGTGATNTVAGTGVNSTCATLVLVGNTVDAACRIAIGRDCI